MQTAEKIGQFAKTRKNKKIQEKFENILTRRKSEVFVRKSFGRALNRESVEKWLKTSG